MKTHRIAVIPGDGIGKEVVPEGIRVLEAVLRVSGRCPCCADRPPPSRAVSGYGRSGR